MWFSWVQRRLVDRTHLEHDGKLRFLKHEARRVLGGEKDAPAVMSEPAVPLVLNRITVTTTLHQQGKTNLSQDEYLHTSNPHSMRRLFCDERFYFVGASIISWSGFVLTTTFPFAFSSNWSSILFRLDDTADSCKSHTNQCSNLSLCISCAFVEVTTFVPGLRSRSRSAGAGHFVWSRSSV